MLSATEANLVGEVKVRQADDETQVFEVTVLENGTIKNFAGLKPFFCLMAREVTGQGVSEEPVTSYDDTKGTLKYTLSANAMQMVGRNEAYFSFRKELSNGEWIEQFSTRSFFYTVEKSIYTQPFKDSNYWWTFKELYRKFLDYQDSGKISWEEFVEQNREILESVDPGGVILTELIDARDSADGVTHPNLKARLDNKEQEFNARLAQNTGVNILTFEDEVTGNDWTSTIQYVLDTFGHAIVPKGIYQIHSTVKVKRNQILELMGESTLIKPANANNIDPVVWMDGNYGVVRGANRRSSFIKSEVETPSGVLALGYKNMADTTAKNVLYATIEHIGISGHKSGGNETGTPSIVLNLANPQINNLPSYFHSIHHLYIENGNVGLMLEGWANANIIGDIQFYRVGNEKWLNGGAIVLKNVEGKGPLDNVINGIFHHGSPNADTLVFVGHSNYNLLTNISSEQGGSQARWINEISIDGQAVPSGNIITGLDNVGGGSKRSPEFNERNTSLNRSTIRTEEVFVKRLESKELQSEKIHLPNYSQYNFFRGGLSENTTIPILSMKIPSRTGGFIQLEVDTEGGVSSFVQFSHLKLGVKRGVSGDLVVQEVLSISSLTGMLSYTTDGDVLTINLKTGNNGTNSNSLTASINYTVSGRLTKATISEL